MTFRTDAPVIEALGHEPIAIKPYFKIPTLEGWTKGLPTQAYLDAGQGDWGTGILTRRTPAIDLDIRSRPLVRLLVEMADDSIGGSPVRFGARPKALLPFSCDEPFSKVTSQWYALPGEDYGAEGYKPNRVEVLGAGQQFVAIAQHPDGFPYRWCRGSLFTQHWIDLPVIDEDCARRFCDAADLVLVSAGCIEVERIPGTKLWRKAEPKPEPRQMSRQRDYRREFAPSAWKSIPLDDLAQRIDPRGRRKSWGWHLRCPAHDDRNPSLSLTDRNGSLAWNCFGGCTGAEVARAIEEIV